MICWIFQIQKLTNNLIDKLFYSQYYNRCIGGEYGHEKFYIHITDPGWEPTIE